MAAIHINTNSIGLQLQAECWYEQEEGHKHDPAPFSLYNQGTTTSRYTSDDKKHSQKKPGKQPTDRGRAWTSQCLHKGESMSLLQGMNRDE